MDEVDKWKTRGCHEVSVLFGRATPLAVPQAQAMHRKAARFTLNHCWFQWMLQMILSIPCFYQETVLLEKLHLFLPCSPRTGQRTWAIFLVWPKKKKKKQPNHGLCSSWWRRTPPRPERRNKAEELIHSYLIRGLPGDAFVCQCLFLFSLSSQKGWTTKTFKPPISCWNKNIKHINMVDHGPIFSLGLLLKIWTSQRWEVRFPKSCNQWESRGNRSKTVVYAGVCRLFFSHKAIGICETNSSQIASKRCL